MNAGVRYGMFLTIVLIPLQFFRESFFIMSAVWAVIGLQLGVAAWLVWRRTGLQFAAAGMALASLSASAFALLHAIGFDPLELSVHLLTFVPVLLVPGVLFWIESRRNREAWRSWEESMEDMRLRDMLRFRHVPDWRRSNEKSHPSRSA